MSQRKNLDELKVGLFISAGLAIAMIIIFMIGGQSQLFDRHYQLFTNFRNISGLRVGAPVQLAGLRIGHVDEIRFSSDQGSKLITVELRLRKKFQDRIRSDSTATIETQGLLGDKFVFISVGSEEQGVIPENGILPSKETTSIFSLADKAGVIMDNIGEAAESINDMLSSVKGTKGAGDFKAIIGSVRKTVEQIEKGKGLAHAVIYDPKGSQVISDLGDTMKSLKGVIAETDKDSKGKVGGILTNLRSASSDLKQIMGSIRRGEGTLGKLAMDPSLYEDLSALFGRANKNRLLRAVIRSTIQQNDKQVLK